MAIYLNFCLKIFYTNLPSSADRFNYVPLIYYFCGLAVTYRFFLFFAEESLPLPTDHWAELRSARGAFERDQSNSKRFHLSTLLKHPCPIFYPHAAQLARVILHHCQGIWLNINLTHTVIETDHCIENEHFNCKLTTKVSMCHKY